MQASKIKRVLVVAGETSGDHHAADLVQALRRLDPNIECVGMGGEAMRLAGVDVRVDAAQLSVVGAVEVLSHALPLYRAWRTLCTLIRSEPWDLVLLIDYPGFNLRLASVAKKAGLKVAYYISPQLWAWRSGRIKYIRRCVDLMLVIFPFEQAVYERAGVPVQYVGHPLAGRVCPSASPDVIRSRLNIEPDRLVVGLVPGSRPGELQRMLGVMLESAWRLWQQHPELVFVWPLAPSLKQSDWSEQLGRYPGLPLHITTGVFYDTLSICQAALVTSGTATLEAALLALPMIVVYKTAAITYHLARAVIRIPYIGLCNIVAGRLIVPELIQQEANPECMVAHLDRMLFDSAYQAEVRASLLLVKEKLVGGSGCADRAAEAVLMCMSDGES